MQKVDKTLVPFNYPLNGRLITKLDGTLLPDAHFQVLENMRYNDGGIEGIGGMTKINAVATTYTKIQNGFHFKKTSPITENHIFIQTSSGANSKILKSDNTTSIPAQDTFSDFITLPTNNTVYFAEAPDQSMVMCDGYTNYVYSGDEYRSAKVVNFDPAGTFFKDHTVIANNNLTDASNIFILSGVAGGIDTNTKALYHFNDALTDATAGAHTLTAVAAPSYVAGRFGNAINLNGSTQYVYTADHADFNLAGNVYTIDCVIHPDDFTANQRPIYYQYATDHLDSFLIYIDITGALGILVEKTGDADFNVQTPDGVITAGQTHHIAIVQNNTILYMFIDGILQYQGTAPTIVQNYTSNICIGTDTPGGGGGVNDWFDGWIEEFRVSNSARWSINFTPPLTPYGTSTNVVDMYIGATRPLSGVKFYPNVANTANTSATPALAYYWNGSAWTSVTSLVDGTLDTATSTKTLSQDGTISFTSTVLTAKVKIINENLAYYYRFTFTGIDVTTALEMVTVKAPVQKLVDIWDGMPRQIYSYLVYTAAYADYTTNVYALDYDSADATTYVNIGALTAAQYTYVGFNERLIGVKIFLGGTSVNTNACVAYVDYWNGTTWANVGAIDDGTTVGGVSFARTGTITWNDPGVTNEFTNSVGNSAQWYYYRIRFSATLSATVRIDHIAGIPVQVNLRPYRYPILWQNRLWLLNDQGANRNSAIGSSYGTVCVFNGNDSGILTFGGMKDLQAAASLYTRYGGTIYENLVVCKNSETYLIDGTSFTGDQSGAGAYVVYKISSTRGCIAPLTMVMCDTGYEVSPGLTKHTLVWLSASGVIMFDANSMIEVSNDIGDRFEVKSSTYLNPLYSNQTASFYDSVRGEYHLMLATGASTTPNEEWVYDVIRKKWYQIKRGAKYLWSGFEIEDSGGNKYAYGGTSDGFIERLEYGTTLDGVNITYKIRLPDSLLNTSWDSRKEMRQVRVVGICKTTTTQKIAISHYADGSNTASSPTITPIDCKITGRRFFKFARSVSLRGTTHSLEFSITTSDEAIGFSPLFIGGQYRVVDYDLEAL